MVDFWNLLADFVGRYGLYMAYRLLGFTIYFQKLTVWGWLQVINDRICPECICF